MCMQHEDALAQAAFEEARRRTRDFEDRDRSHREDLEVRGPCKNYSRLPSQKRRDYCYQKV